MAMSPSSRRALAFVGVFAVAGFVQFAILLATPMRPLVDGFSGYLAVASSWMIHSFGGTCLRQAAILSNPARSFAMEIRDGCNGINVVILLWSAILAYPAPFRWKMVGLSGGLAAIQLLNLVRLISLFYLGQYSPSLFEFAHLYLWEFLIILDGMVVFVLWIRRTPRSLPLYR